MSHFPHSLVCIVTVKIICPEGVWSWTTTFGHLRAHLIFSLYFSFCYFLITDFNGHLFQLESRWLTENWKTSSHWGADSVTWKSQPLHRGRIVTPTPPLSWTGIKQLYWNRCGQRLEFFEFFFNQQEAQCRWNYSIKGYSATSSWQQGAVERPKGSVWMLWVTFGQFWFLTVKRATLWKWTHQWYLGKLLQRACQIFHNLDWARHCTDISNYFKDIWDGLKSNQHFITYILNRQSTSYEPKAFISVFAVLVLTYPYPSSTWVQNCSCQSRKLSKYLAVVQMATCSLKRLFVAACC